MIKKLTLNRSNAFKFFLTTAKGLSVLLLIMFAGMVQAVERKGYTGAECVVRPIASSQVPLAGPVFGGEFQNRSYLSPNPGTVRVYCPIIDSSNNGISVIFITVFGPDTISCNLEVTNGFFDYSGPILSSNSSNFTPRAMAIPGSGFTSLSFNRVIACDLPPATGVTSYTVREN